MPEINTGNVPTNDTTPQVINPVQPLGTTQEATPQAVPQAPITPEPAYTQPAPVAPVPQALPTEVQDRTREQFEKLLESNSKLFEANEVLRQELEARTEASRQFEPTPQPVQTPSTQLQTVDPMDFVYTDPITGARLIDEKKFKEKIDEINNKASKVDQIEQTVKQYTQVAEQREIERQNREIERQNREAFTAYPELDPNRPDKFNKTFSNQTRALIYDSLINPQDYNGRSLDFKEAADFVRAQYQGTTTTMQGQTLPSEQKQSDAAQTLKQQASLGANGQQPMERTNESADVDLQSLRLKTRLGDRMALAQRIFAAEQAAKGGAEAS